MRKFKIDKHAKKINNMVIGDVVETKKWIIEKIRKEAKDCSGCSFGVDGCTVAICSPRQPCNFWIKLYSKDDYSIYWYIIYDLEHMV